MKKVILLFSTFVMLFNLAFCQRPRPAGSSCQDSKFDKEVAKYLTFSVTPIDVDSLKKIQNSVVLLDAREPSEFAVSHIDGAINCGYDNLNFDALKNMDKNKKIVVYCSIGYRSEQVGKKLQKMGFVNVQNLYGSLFEWVNRGNEVVDKSGKKTTKVHTFDKKWSKWVKNSKCEKIY